MVAIVALAAALVLGWGRLVPLPLVAVGGVYAAQLAVDDQPLDTAAALVAAGLLVAFELAYWSLDERDGIRAEAGESLRRLALLAGLAVGALLLAIAVLSLVEGVRARGLAIDLVGVAAAAAALLAIVMLVGRRAPEGH